MIKFFLGSVPFGCDNIGDEAILESTIEILRRNFPHCQICVATAKPTETAKLFNCKAVGLLGFGNLDSNRAETIKAIKESDVYLWAGATGLSDYPEAGLVGLRIAQKAGLRTVVWNVGMDSEFNPAYFKLRGKKAKLCNISSKFTLNKIDVKTLAERYMSRKIGKTIASVLQKCDMVVLRDTLSLKRLRKFASLPNAIVAADSATILTSHSDEFLNCLSAEKKNALMSDCEKIGVCVSSQRALSDLDGFAKTLDSLLAEKNRKIFFIPMNPKTDTALMSEIQKKLKFKEKTFLLGEISDWRNVLAVASHCDAIISSRLHLLILSANVGTPIVGISRGSKIATFLSKFGASPAGNVDNCRLEKLERYTEYALANKKVFLEKREEVYDTYSARLSYAERYLKEVISDMGTDSSTTKKSSTDMQSDDLNLIRNPDGESISSIIQNRDVSENFLSLFMFDIRAMLLYLITKWKGILAVFVITLVVGSQLLYFYGHYSARAWSSTVKIYHQTRSDKIPTFYIPMRTETVAHIFTSSNVSGKVSADLKMSLPNYKPSMLSNVVVSVEKAKSDIITITAYAPSPKIATTIANKVADFGIAEYLSRQNSAINEMVNDRLSKKKERLAEISRIKDSMCALMSKEYKCFPPEEMELRKTELSTISAKLAETKIKLSDTDIKIEELERLLRETPRDVEFETTHDHTTEISLEGKLSTLKQLRKRYTDQNPKIIMLLEEIKDLQEQAALKKEKSLPSKITYRKNLTYNEFETQLLSARLEKKSLQKMISVYENEIKVAQAEIEAVHDNLHKYEELRQREDALLKQLERINLSLQNLEVLLTTSIPDLTIFSHADVPSSSTMKNRNIKTVALAVFMSILYIAYVVLAKILKFRFLASKEFENFAIKDFGEVPLMGSVAKHVRDSAITRSYSFINKLNKKKGIVLFVKYNDSQCCNSIIDDMITLNSFNDLNTFRIDCRYKEERRTPPKFYKSIKVDDAETATSGVFEYYDPLHIHEEKYHRLVDDIEVLLKKHDTVAMTILCKDNYLVVSQLAKIANAIIFIPAFDSTRKVNVITPKNMVKNLLTEEKDFGGLLIQVPRYYYERR
ncbi:MAG: hypothetical protein E7036_02460 [Opitutales bacterium]|nr:hypothetical protein [Opitutales bacterium]